MLDPLTARCYTKSSVVNCERKGGFGFAAYNFSHMAEYTVQKTLSNINCLHTFLRALEEQLGTGAPNAENPGTIRHQCLPFIFAEIWSGFRP